MALVAIYVIYYTYSYDITIKKRATTFVSFAGVVRIILDMIRYV